MRAKKPKRKYTALSRPPKSGQSRDGGKRPESPGRLSRRKKLIEHQRQEADLRTRINMGELEAEARKRRIVEVTLQEVPEAIGTKFEAYAAIDVIGFGELIHRSEVVD